MAGELGANGGFHQSLWRFDVLQDPLLKARAVRDVAQADLLIISAHRDVPVEFGGLLEAWLTARKSRDSALVAVVELEDPFGSTHTPAGARLGRLARRHRLNFLEQVVDDGQEDRRVRRLALAWVF